MPADMKMGTQPSLINSVGKLEFFAGFDGLASNSQKKEPNRSNILALNITLKCHLWAQKEIKTALL